MKRIVISFLVVFILYVVSGKLFSFDNGFIIIPDEIAWDFNFTSPEDIQQIISIESFIKSENNIKYTNVDSRTIYQYNKNRQLIAVFRYNETKAELLDSSIHLQYENNKLISLAFLGNYSGAPAYKVKYIYDKWNNLKYMIRYIKSNGMSISSNINFYSNIYNNGRIIKSYIYWDSGFIKKRYMLSEYKYTSDNKLSEIIFYRSTGDWNSFTNITEVWKYNKDGHISMCMGNEYNPDNPYPKAHKKKNVFGSIDYYRYKNNQVKEKYTCYYCTTEEVRNKDNRQLIYKSGCRFNKSNRVIFDGQCQGNGQVKTGLLSE